jgi:hypothetical protein
MKKNAVAIAVAAGLTALSFAAFPLQAGAARQTSVVTFADAHFAESVAEGLAGKGCQNVVQDNTTSSIWVNGGPVKVWSEKNCKGESRVLTGDVADLGTIGFDNTISSIAFG